MRRPVWGVARSAPADAACLGSGSATSTLVHPCITSLLSVLSSVLLQCRRRPREDIRRQHEDREGQARVQRSQTEVAGPA